MERRANGFWICTIESLNFELRKPRIGTGHPSHPLQSPVSPIARMSCPCGLPPRRDMAGDIGDRTSAAHRCHTSRERPVPFPSVSHRSRNLYLIAADDGGSRPWGQDIYSDGYRVSRPSKPHIGTGHPSHPLQSPVPPIARMSCPCGLPPPPRYGGRHWVQDICRPIPMPHITRTSCPFPLRFASV